jgi:hypothetical protein
MEKFDSSYTKEPAYWFVRLEQAVGRGDLIEAIRCSRNLLQLGVEVRYVSLRPGVPRQGGGHGA